MLSELLGEGITDAFLVQPKVAEPQLVVATKDREAVETAGARILLAQTALTVDGSGAYRGVMVCRVDNRTEQFLELTLPATAELWTAHVAGKPVKPIVASKPVVATLDQPPRVRIPLIMTAEGDRDFAVELKYGGQMARLGYFNKVDFPLIRSETIQIEESQVRLWLPPTHRWFGFDGTMRLATQDSDLLAGYVKYKTQQIRSASEGLRSANPYTRLRARSNLTLLGQEVQQLNDTARGVVPLQRELNTSWGEAQQRLNEQQQQGGQDGLVDDLALDNRKQLDLYFQQQANGVGRNEVDAQATNFGRFSAEPAADEKAGSPEAPAQPPVGQIESRWFDESGLAQSGQKKDNAASRINMDEARGRRSDVAAKGVASPVAAPALSAPGVAAGDTMEKLKQAASEVDRAKQEVAEEQTREGKLQRFQSQLQSETQRQLASDKPAQQGEDGAPPTNQPTSGRVMLGVGVNADSGLVPGGQSQEKVPMGESLRFSNKAENDRGMAEQAVPTRMRGEALGVPATGLASLDVQFPTRGHEYRFSTPRGDTQIVARALDRPLSDRLLRLVALALSLVLTAFVGRQLKHCRVDAILNPFVCVLLIVVGLSLLVLGIIPLLALAAFVLGCGQLVRLAWIRRQKPVAA